MQKTTTVNLGRQSFQLEEDAYKKLEGYLNSLKAKMSKDDAGSIMEDYEVRIAEHLNKLQPSTGEALNSTIVDQVLEKMGNVEEIKTSYEEEQKYEVKEAVKKPMKKMIFGGIALVLLVGIFGSLFFLANYFQGYIRLSNKQQDTINQNQVHEFFLEELNGKTIDMYQETDFKVIPMNATKLTGKDADGEEFEASLSDALGADYGLEDREDAITVRMYKYKNTTEAGIAKEMYEESFANAGQGFEEKKMRISGATTIFLYRDVESDKQEEQSSAEVVMIFADAPVSITLSMGGKYTENEAREIVKSYLEGIAGSAETVSKDEVMTLSDYLKILQDNLVDTFSEKGEEFLDDFLPENNEIQGTDDPYDEFKDEVQKQIDEVKKEFNQ